MHQIDSISALDRCLPSHPVKSEIPLPPRLMASSGATWHCSLSDPPSTRSRTDGANCFGADGDLPPGIHTSGSKPSHALDRLKKHVFLLGCI